MVENVPENKSEGQGEWNKDQGKTISRYTVGLVNAIRDWCSISPEPYVYMEDKREKNESIHHLPSSIGHRCPCRLYSSLFASCAYLSITLPIAISCHDIRGDWGEEARGMWVWSWGEWLSWCPAEAPSLEVVATVAAGTRVGTEWSAMAHKRCWIRRALAPSRSIQVLHEAQFITWSSLRWWLSSSKKT